MIKIKGCGYEALINEKRGANCVSLKNTRYRANVLREPPKNGILDNPYLYGMPILYPVNRIDKGRFVYEDREYCFPINEEATECHLHGSLHYQEFSVIEKGEDFVKLGKDTEYSFFPHKFRIEITYGLSQTGLEQNTVIYNLSDKRMPSFLGYHTTFNVPFIEGACAESTFVRAQCGSEIERDNRFLPTGRVLPEDDFIRNINNGSLAPFEEIFSKHCKAKDNGIIELIDTKNRIKVVYENDEKFKYRLFYNGNGDEYVCLEPMTCLVNCMNYTGDREEVGFDTIDPFDKKEYYSRICVEEF